MSEQKYQFIDKSGHCLLDFLDINDSTMYREMVAHLLEPPSSIWVGDMIAFKEEFEDLGFEWGKDFYFKKIKD